MLVRVRILSLVVALALLAGVVCGPLLARTCQLAGKEEGNVKVTLVVILASYESEETDPRLAEIAKEVKRCCKKLKGFKLHVMTCKSLPVHKKTTFPLVEDQVAHVIINHGADSKNRVSLSVDPPQTGTITYRTTCGKFLPIITPYHTKTKTKDRLLLAIRVQPCNDD